MNSLVRLKMEIHGFVRFLKRKMLIFAKFSKRSIFLLEGFFDEIFLKLYSSPRAVDCAWF